MNLGACSFVSPILCLLGLSKKSSQDVKHAVFSNISSARNHCALRISEIARTRAKTLPEYDSGRNQRNVSARRQMKENDDSNEQPLNSSSLRNSRCIPLKGVPTNGRSRGSIDLSHCGFCFLEWRNENWKCVRKRV